MLLILDWEILLKKCTLVKKIFIVIQICLEFIFWNIRLQHFVSRNFPFVCRRKSNRISTTATFISVGSRLSNGICVSHAFCFMIESGAYLIFLDYFDKMSISYLASGDFYQYWKTFYWSNRCTRELMNFFGPEQSLI